MELQTRQGADSAVPAPPGVPAPRAAGQVGGRTALQELARELAVTVDRAGPAPAVPLDLPTLLAGLGTMAASGPVALQVMQLTSDPTCGAPQLAATLAADAVLSAKVLRLANSAAYGMSSRVRDLPRAVAVVGTSSISTLAALSVAGLDDPQLPARFWNRSVATAAASRVLARPFGLPPQDALVTGLVSNLGAALLFRHDTGWYRRLLAGQPTRAEALAAELERYGRTSAEVTAAALASWSFPDSVVEAVHPPQGEPSAPARCLATVHEAVGRVLDGRHEPADPEPLSGGVVDEARLRGTLPLVVGEVERMLRVLSSGRAR